MNSPLPAGTACDDICIVDGEGEIGLDYDGNRICDGVSLGQCDTMWEEIDEDCPWLHYVSIVDDGLLENFTLCGFGRCVYMISADIHYPNETNWAWIMAHSLNQETMDDKLNALCMQFIEEDEPLKGCLQASFFPFDEWESGMICLYSFKRSMLDFDLIEELFEEPELLQGGVKPAAVGGGEKKGTENKEVDKKLAPGRVAHNAAPRHPSPHRSLAQVHASHVRKKGQIVQGKPLAPVINKSALSYRKSKSGRTAKEPQVAVPNTHNYKHLTSEQVKTKLHAIREHAGMPAKGARAAGRVKPPTMVNLHPAT
jgi:hypothetical protein